MPTRILRAARLAAIAAACLVALPATAAASKPADLRIVDSSGETLAEHTQYTGKTTIRARAAADCFGDGTGGSGERVTVPGATALGAARDASRWDRDIRPVLITDAFDFGLGVCGFADAVAPQTGYWYLKVNRVGALVGGDQARIRRGDRVLWYLIEDFNEPLPTELSIKAPARTAAEQFSVRVWEYADDGSRAPAAGAAVTGASALTGPDGRTVVEAAFGDPRGPGAKLELRATRAGSIPSEVGHTCLAPRPRACGSKPPTTIRGTGGSETVRGTGCDDDIDPGRGRDLVRAGAGDDTIDVRGGGRDSVRCGGGEDRVRADRRDTLKGCG
jgi:hypothetical protein